MRHLALSIVFAAMALSLTGCLMGMDVNVAGTSGHPTFKIKSGQFLDHTKMCPQFVWVQALHTQDRMWSMSSSKCIPLTEIVYGSAPEGFKTLAPARALEDNQVYTIFLDGDGYVGSLDFAFRNGAYVVVEHK